MLGGVYMLHWTSFAKMYKESASMIRACAVKFYGTYYRERARISGERIWEGMKVDRNQSDR